MSIASAELKRKPKSESNAEVKGPLTSDALRKMDAYWARPIIFQSGRSIFSTILCYASR